MQFLISLLENSLLNQKVLVDLLVPNQVLKSHERFIWRRLWDEERYFPLLVVRNVYLEF